MHHWHLIVYVNASICKTSRSQNRAHTESRLRQKRVTCMHRHAMICNDSSSQCARHVPRQCAYERHSPSWTSAILNIFRWWIPLMSALARIIATTSQRLYAKNRPSARLNRCLCQCIGSVNQMNKLSFSRDATTWKYIRRISTFRAKAFVTVYNCIAWLKKSNVSPKKHGSL